MKSLIFILGSILFSLSISAQNSPEKWVKSIIKDMKNVEDLDKYASVDLPSHVSTNVVLVDRTKDLEVNENTFSFVVDHGNGKFCSKMVFEYVKQDGEYKLVFAEPHASTIFGKEKWFANPWKEKIRLCK